jgi:hypothetical protein
MEQKINVAELLKDCPRGMELDCAMIENVYFDEVLTNSIKCYYIKNSTKTRSTIYFTKFGEYVSIDNAKCVIFPKGKTTWEGFQRPFKDGDIIFTGEDCTRTGLGNTWISIFEENRNGGVATYVDYCNEGKDFYTYLDDKGLLCLKEDIIQQRLATEEEKQRIFQAIKDNGYKWNEETKTLERLVEPQFNEFKDGDVVVSSLGNIHILKNRNTSYIFVDFEYDSKGCLCKSLTTCVNAIRLATEKEKQRLFQAIEDNGYKWNPESKTLEELTKPKFKVGDKIRNGKTTIKIGHIDDEYYYEIGRNISNRLYIKNQDDWELVPDKFDITTLKPFESRVLVRTGNRKWVAAFYGHYDKDSSLNSYLSYCVVGGSWYEQCIPYEGNEHLLNTTDDCNEFYKNW